MEKIYLVLYTESDERIQVWGAFSTREKAESYRERAFQEKFSKDRFVHPSNFDIEEVEIDREVYS